MDEKYISDLYNQLGGKSVFGEYNDFKSLINTDDSYASDVYNQMGGESVFGKYDDFRNLTKSSPSLQLKKKGDTTESPSEVGSLASSASADPEALRFAELVSKQGQVVGKRRDEPGYVDPRKKLGMYPTQEETNKAITQFVADIDASKGMAPEYEEKDFFEGGVKSTLRALDTYFPGNLGEAIDDTARTLASAYAQGQLISAANDLMLTGKVPNDEDVDRLIEYDKIVKETGPSDAFINYQKKSEELGGGWFGFLRGVMDNPAVLPELIVNSAATMATNKEAVLAGGTAILTNALATAATAGIPTAGAAAAPGFLAGATAAIPVAMGLASGIVTTGATFAELLQKELGVDENGNPVEPTQENIKAILENPEKLNRIRNKSIVKGAAVGFIDFVTGRTASAVGAKILSKSAAKSATGEATKAAYTTSVGAGSAIESTGGAFGEFAGTALAGEKQSLENILFEGITEMPLGALSTFQARMATPVYKVNKKKVTAEQIDEIIDTMEPADLAVAKIEIENDYEGRKKRMQDKIVTGSIANEVRAAQPNLNEPTVNAIVDLQKQLNALEGNKTQVAKDKAAQIRAEIKNLQENPIIETKPKEDAIQEQAAGEVPVQSGATVSEEVAQGVPQAEPQVVTEAGVQEEVEVPVINNITPLKQEGWFIGRFGKKGGITWEIPESQRETSNPNYLILQSIESNQPESKGEGSNAIAALFNMYPSATEMIFDVEGSKGFYEKIGAVGETLKREDFFKYYNSKVSSETQPAVSPAPAKKGKAKPTSVEAVSPTVSPTPTAQPITITDIKVSFAPENAIEVQKGTREDTSGRKFTYDSAVTAQATDQNGVPIGIMTKRADGEGKLSFTVKDSQGRNINKGKAYPTERDARTALVEQVNKVREKTIKTKDDEQVQSKRGGDRGKGRTTVSEITPLQGAPKVQGATGPDKQLVSVAEKYAADNKIEFKRQGEYVEVDENRAKKLAEEYEKMANDPSNPTVKEAYAELIRQTKAQYQALVDAGYKFWFIDLNNPNNIEYISSPYNAMRDLRQNKEMGVFPTELGFGTDETVDVSKNPLLEDTGITWPSGGLDGEMKPVTANDLFRAVHDAFGHGLEGAGFRARGEENAWQAHVRLFTGKAIGAMTSETRGQNSWVNYGPNGETNRTASAEETVFADQKVGLMPEFTWTEGRAADMETEAKPAAKKAPAKKAPAKKAPTKTEPEAVEQVQGKLDELLTLDPKAKGTGKKILDGIDNLIKEYEDIEKKGLNLGLALSSIKEILKGIRALVEAGIVLADAIKKVAKDNNVSAKDVIDGINAIGQIAPIQAAYDALMTKADALIARQKSRGIAEKKIVSNLDTMIRNSEVYKNANDAQRKIMEREARAKMGVGPRKAASIGRVIGVLKDITNVTREEKLKIISRIRELGKDVGRELAKEIRAMKVNGQITTFQATNIIARLANVNTLNETSVSNFVDYMAEVFAKVKEKNRQSLLNDLVKLVSAKAKTAKTESGKRRSKGLDAVGQSFFDAIKPIIKAAAKGDTETLQKIKQSIDNDLIETLIIKTINGEELTTRERVLLDQALAYDTFADLANMDIEQIQKLFDQLKDARTESIAKLKSRRIERAQEVKALHDEVDANIKEGFGILYNEDGTLKNENQLRAESDAIWESFSKLKIWDGVKKLFERYDFTVSKNIFDFVRKTVSHIGTISNILDKKGKFFTDNVYRALNKMDTAHLEGYFNQREILDEMANKIDGITKGFRDFRSKMSNKVIVLDNIIDSKTKSKFKNPINQDQAMRIYALYKNPIQRAKLVKMGFDEATMKKIEDFIGADGMQMADMIVDYFSNDYYESVNKVYRKVNDVSLGYVENYFPTQTIAANVDGDMLINGNFSGIFDAETAPSLKERTDTTSDVLLGAAFTDVVESHIQTMERYKAYAEGVKRINSIFKSPAVQTLLGRYGTELSSVYKSLINFAVNPNGGAKIQQTLLDKVMNKFAGFALAFKLVQIPKQATSFITAFEDYNFRGEGKNKIPGLDMLMFMVDAAKTIATLPTQVKKALEISASFKDRLEKGLDGDVYGLESGSATFKSIGKSNNLIDRTLRALKKGSGFPTVLGDILGVMGYMINYNRNIANGMSEADALEAFNNYNATQQSRRAADKIPLQQSQSALVRAFTMFGSTTFLQINKAVQGTTNIMRSLKAKKMPEAKDMRAVALNVALANAFFVLASNMAKLIDGDEEDEEEVLKAIGEALLGLNLVYQIPLIGGAVELAIKKANNDNRPVSDVINPYITVFNKIYKGVKEDDIIKSGQPIIEIILGTQLDQFVGLFNTFGEGFTDENVYDMLGISKSYRPGGGVKDSDSKDTKQEEMTKTDMKKRMPKLYKEVYGETDDIMKEIRKERKDILKESGIEIEDEDLSFEN
jgi:hypothetical protein